MVMLITTHLFAQTPALTPTQTEDLENMKKYWFYHYRLVNDFLAKGEGKGESLPMGERAVQGGNLAQWGDGTLVLAHYIAVLATEYKLLRDNNQLTDTTVQELYYAIKAFDRLDFYAESNTKYCVENKQINGFFMRDDVSSTFFGTQANPKHQKLAQGKTTHYPVNDVISDYRSHEDDYNNRSNEMSHDQVWHLFTAFALVRRCLDYGSPITYQGKIINNYDPSAIQTADLREEVKNMMNRLMTYIKGPNGLWMIWIPGQNGNHHVHRGWDAAYLSYGAAEAANYINGDHYNSNSVLNWPYVHTDCPSTSTGTFQNAISKPLCASWMQDGAAINLTNIDAIDKELLKRENLATIGNSWYTHPFPTSVVPPNAIANIYWQDKYTPWDIPGDIADLIAQSIQLPQNVTMPEVTYKVWYFYPYIYWHLPLQSSVLHPGSAPVTFPAQVFKNLLHSAPTCGPYNFGGNNFGNHDWITDSRVYDVENIWKNDPPSPLAAYNGLDYMLYYNLYHIGMNSSLVPTVNYMDRVVTIPFPQTSPAYNPPGSTTYGTTINEFGSTSNPAILIAINTLTATHNTTNTSTNTINNNANVTYRAGNEITLLPGFSAVTGSNFHAYIQPFDCSTDIEDQTYKSSISDANNTSDQSLTYNLTAYTGQTTFVNYPKATDNNSYPSNNDNISLLAQNTNSPVPIKTQFASTQSLTVSGISIIPNPNNGTFHIAVTHNNQFIGVKELKVFDIMGKIIWSTGASANTVFSIDISAYSAGIYYVRCVNELGEIETKKLIKQ